MLHYKNNTDLLEEYDRRVFGHAHAKKVLISLVNRSKMRHKQKYEDCLPSQDLLKPMKCLLLGESGTGKSYLVQQLKEIADFPLLAVDATQLNPTGASGGITKKGLEKIIRENAEDVVIARNKKGYTNSVEGIIDQTIVFVDEIDKLANSFESSGNWNRHVQSNFLTLFDNYGEFSGVSFIFAGAFADMKIAGKKSNSIGFNIPIMAETDDIIDDALVKYGLIPELVGRFSHIVRLDKFSEEDYLRILAEDIIPNKVFELMCFNNSYISFNQQELQNIVSKAMKSGQGVRFLKRELDKLCLEVEFNYENNVGPNQLPFLDTFADMFAESMTKEELKNIFDEE